MRLIKSLSSTVFLRLLVNYLIILRLQNYIKSRSYATSIDKLKVINPDSTKKPEKKINKAMLMYLKRAKEHGNNRSIFLYIYF